MERNRIRRTNFRRIGIVLLTLLVAFNCMGCVQKFTPKSIPPVQITPPEKYEIGSDLNKIPKPTKIQRQYAKVVDDTLVFVQDPKDANVFVIAPEEYAKVNMLKELSITYKKVIYKQEDLVNLKNETICELLRVIALVEQQRDLAFAAWENSENMYRQEQRSHKVDNLINKTGMTLISIGTIALIIVAL